MLSRNGKSSAHTLYCRGSHLTVPFFASMHPYSAVRGDIQTKKPLGCLLPVFTICSLSDRTINVQTKSLFSLHFVTIGILAVIFFPCVSAQNLNSQHEMQYSWRFSRSWELSLCSYSESITKHFNKGLQTKKDSGSCSMACYRSDRNY